MKKTIHISESVKVKDTTISPIKIKKFRYALKHFILIKAAEHFDCGDMDDAIKYFLSGKFTEGTFEFIEKVELIANDVILMNLLLDEKNK